MSGFFSREVWRECGGRWATFLVASCGIRQVRLDVWVREESCAALARMALGPEGVGPVGVHRFEFRLRGERGKGSDIPV